ncbi:MAG TPA: M14 family zinc carboxypeptidase [bacterium]|nr:M14 family zinc carboxypeptidase [bacterium]
MKKLVIALCIMVMSYAAAEASSPARFMAELSLKDYQVLAREYGSSIRDHLDVVEKDSENRSVNVLVTPSGEDILTRAAVPFRTVMTGDALRDSRDIDPQFLDYTEVTTMLASLEATYPSIVHRVELATTYENRKVWAVKISDNVLLQEGEPEMLVLGLHEAREIMSTEIAMDMAQYLAQNYGSDPEVTNWVNTWQIWIVPMLNPDGSAYCWSTDPYWVKNRRDLGGETYGVALGHNYSVDWGACFGSSSDPNSNGYRGDAPGSEPEIQSIMTLAQQHAFMTVLSYHSFDEFVLYPYGCWGENAPEDAILSDFADSVGDLIQRDDGGYGYDTGTWWERLYSNDGNETDYFYAEYGSLAVAVEVNAETYYPSYTLRNTTVTRNRAGWQEILDLYETGSIVQGTITDACTGQPVQATYYFEEYPLTPKESLRQNNPVTGFYTAVGHSGTLHLIVEADGYISSRVPIQFGSGPVTYDVQLLPVNEPGLAIWAVVIEDQAGDDDGQLDPGETAYVNIAVWAPGAPVSGIAGLMTTSDPYLTINDNAASWTDLPAGGGAYCSFDRFQVTASAATPEYHQAAFTLTFNTNENLCDPDDEGSIRIFSINYMCPFYEENFNSDPGWDISAYPTQGSPPGPYNNWEFGEPVVGPDSAYTGLYVYGTGLAGNYDNYWTLCLTSPPIDCSGVTEVALKFAQFYEVEANWDHARVRIRNDGGTWITILDEDGSSGGWQWRELDISAWADEEPEVEVRFDVRADYTISQAGHYIDDFWICGMAAGAGQVQPTPTLPPTSTPTPTPTPTSECIPHGDVNNDQEITAGDAQLAFLIALGAHSPTPFEFCAADCNGDEEVTAGDAQGVFLTALGSPTCVDPLLDRYAPKAAVPVVKTRSGRESGAVRKSGDVWEVDIRVETSTEVDAFLMDIGFDGDRFDFIEAVPGDLNPGWLDFDGVCYAAGRIRAGGYSSGLDPRCILPSGVIGSLVRLRFAPRNDRLMYENESPSITVYQVFDDLSGTDLR